jgi:hypothetical protein
VREFLISTFGGIAMILCWIAIWNRVLRGFGVALFGRTPEERSARRERIIRMGKFRYIVIHGVLGFGLAFGIAMVSRDVFGGDSPKFIAALWKLLATSVLFGWLHGTTTWNESFSDKDPFPPRYPPLNQ